MGVEVEDQFYVLFNLFNSSRILTYFYFTRGRETQLGFQTLPILSLGGDLANSFSIISREPSSSLAVYKQAARPQCPRESLTFQICAWWVACGGNPTVVTYVKSHFCHSWLCSAFCENILLPGEVNVYISALSLLHVTSILGKFGDPWTSSRPDRVGPRSSCVQPASGRMLLAHGRWAQSPGCEGGSAGKAARQGS